MKNPRSIKSLVLAALPIVSLAYGADPAPAGSLSSVTFAFTLSQSVDGTVAKDASGKAIKAGEEGAGTAYHNEWTITDAKKLIRTNTVEDATKIITTKYSVKEFLTDLLDEQEPLITDIKGWTIQKLQITTGSGVNLDIGPAEYFLVKKGVAPIALGNRIRSYSERKLSGLTQKVVTTSKGTKVGEGAEEVVTYDETGKVITYSQNLKFVGGFEVGVTGNKSIEAYGIYTGGQKLGATKTKQAVILSTAAKLTSLAGESNEGEIAEGTAAYGAGVAVDATPYIPAPVVTVQ